MSSAIDHELFTLWCQSLCWVTEDVIMRNATALDSPMPRGKVPLLLRWLRTFFVNYDDYRRTIEPLKQQPHTERLILNGPINMALGLPDGILPCLMTLDLRGITRNHTYPSSSEDDIFLKAIAQRHPRLRRLYLEMSSFASQSSLEGFRHLEELDITDCDNITDIGFCASTLRVLYASYSSVRDKGLRRAVHLEVLHVAGCRGVTTVEPFAATLHDLDASGYYCGITSKGLVDATNIVSLNVRGNAEVTTLQPFHDLRNLTLGYESGIGNSALAHATNLVTLDVSENSEITIVPPSVRELVACRSDCGISDSSLQNATQLVTLDARRNDRITTLKPFAASLRFLQTKAKSKIVAEAKQLVESNGLTLKLTSKRDKDGDSYGDDSHSDSE